MSENINRRKFINTVTGAVTVSGLGALASRSEAAKPADRKQLSEPARAGEWKVDVFYQRQLLERHSVQVR